MKKYQVLFVFFIVVFSFRLFEATFIDKSIVNYSGFIPILIVIAVSAPFFFTKHKIFVLPVQLIVISIFFSMLMAYLSWGQSFTESITETVPFLVWILFFYLLHIKIPVKTVEKIILTYGVIYVILYFFQLAVTPDVLFGVSQTGKFVVDRGIYRIIFPGGGIFFLAAFLALNKLTTQRRKRWFWLLFSLLGIIISILQVTRIFIAGVLFIYLLHFMQKQSIYKKVIILASFLAIFFFVANLNNQVVKGLKKATITDAKQGRDYIRIKSGSYFLTDFSPNIMNQILGNGVPNSGNTTSSQYGNKIKQLYKQGYYMEDCGMIGMYTMFGVLPIIAYFLIWYKSFTLKLPQEYNYVKYYLWFLLIICLTTDNVYSINFLISTVFALYIYQTIYEKQLVLKNALNEELEYSIRLAK